MSDLTDRLRTDPPFYGNEDAQEAADRLDALEAALTDWYHGDYAAIVEQNKTLEAEVARLTQADEKLIVRAGELRSIARQLAVALKDHEWVWLQNDTGARCLWCRNLREWGHKADCTWHAALAAAQAAGIEVDK